ncbi:MAG: M24 family metallopeptidase [Planctomycetota bacterium]|jgi:Xaa-Pro aminopeptidase|nr:M24 family metallopeptidase [Planctomycetota bacterium]MDP7250300.1 M24 family metallopeptidase [Planctomycetota bacterium]
MTTTGWKEKDDRTIAEIRAYLTREKLDAFIPWKVPHLAYLTNYFDQLHMNILWEEMMAVLVIPLDSAPFIVGEHQSWAGSSEFGVAPWWLEERHSTNRPGRNALERTVELLKEKGLGTGRIGIETLWMPVAAHDYLRSALPDAEFVSADTLVPQIRFIKTSREQELMKKAADTGIRAMEAYMQAIRSGLSRTEAQRLRAQRALDYGGEWVGGVSRHAWTGGTDETPAWWDADARRRFLSTTARNWKGLPDDSPVCVTHYSAIFQYYFSDLAWHEFYGPEPAESEMLQWVDREIPFHDARRDFEILRRVQKEALEPIRPGMSHLEAKAAVDAWLAADAESKEHITNYYIHGIGLEIHEEPVLTGSVPIPTPADVPILFQPGAVVSSEWFTQLWTVEEPFVLTESGWEPLAELKDLTDPAALLCTQVNR